MATLTASERYETIWDRLRQAKEKHRLSRERDKARYEKAVAVAQRQPIPTPEKIAQMRETYESFNIQSDEISDARMATLYPEGFRDVNSMEAWGRLDPSVAESLSKAMDEEEGMRDKASKLNSFLIYAERIGEPDSPHYKERLTRSYAALGDIAATYPELAGIAPPPEPEPRYLTPAEQLAAEGIEQPSIAGYPEPTPYIAELEAYRRPGEPIEPGTYEIDGKSVTVMQDFSVIDEQGKKIGDVDPTTGEIKPITEEAPPLTEMEKLVEEAYPITSSLEALGALGSPIAFAAEKGGQILTAPFRPEPIEPIWRPPTDTEKARGIHMYQPTLAAEKTYEEWVDPAWEIPFLPLFHLPWTSEEVRDKKWRLGVKGLAEEFVMLPIWFAAGLGGKAAKDIYTQAVKISAKKAAGKTLSKSEEQILKQVTKIEANISKQVAEKAPDLAKVEQMWAAEAIAKKATFDEKAFTFWRVLEEKLTDKFAGINKLSGKARGQWAKSHPKQPFPLALDAELHAANLGGAADAGIQRAVDSFHKMKQVLGKDTSVNYVDNYLHLKHNLDVLTMHPARKVSGGLEGVEGVNKALAQMESLIGKESFARVEGAAKQITNHYRQYLERSVDSGLVSREVADMLIKKYPNYNPIAYLARVAEHAEGGVGKALSVTKNDIMALSEMGSVAARERPLNTLARLSIQKETLIRRNEAAKAIRDLVKGDEQLRNQIAKLSPTQRGVLSYMEAGERHTVAVPEWLAKEAGLLGQLGYKDLERLGQVLNAASRFGMTTANLAFFVPNMAVDSLTAMITYGVGPARLAKRLAFNLKDIVKEDKVLSELRRAGGSMSGFWGKTPEQIAKEATKKGQLVLQSKWDWKRILGLPFETITKIGHAVEMTPRSAVFELELKRGKLLDYAALAARRATIDFQRSGTAIRQANSLFLYLNAGVQGSLIPFRALRDLPRSRIWLSGYLGATVGNYAWNRQFPEYEDVPDWAKYGAFPVMLPSQEYDKRGAKVPHYILVVPNLREWALFSGPLVYAMRKLDKKSPDDFSQFLEAWLPPLNPASQIVGQGGMPVPTQIGQVLTELSMNRDTFRQRDIVPEELINLPPAEQYNEWTSITARRIGEALGYSPMKIDFAVRGILGGLGTQFLTAFDGVIDQIEKEGGDPRIQLLLEQLKGIQETASPEDIPARRHDFLESLTPEDRDAILSLEISPEKRIPIVSDILRRIYREKGGQIYQTAKRNVKKALDNDNSLETAQEELNKSAEQNALNFMNGLISGQEYAGLLSDYRQHYRGRTAEAWRMRELMGSILSADVQAYLPEEYRWKPEEQALHTYHQYIDTAYKQLAGVETDENVSRVWEAVDAYVNSLSPELRAYVNNHKNDWINDLPPEAQRVQRIRVADMDYISQSGYWDIPTMTQQREAGVKKVVDKRGDARVADPQLDAMLVFWFDYITSLKSTNAQKIVEGKATELGRPLSSISGYAKVKPQQELAYKAMREVANMVQADPTLAEAIRSGNFIAEQRRQLVTLYTKLYRLPATGKAFEEWLSVDLRAILK